MKSVALHNLGCKVNGYEIEVMQQMLQESGYKIVPFDEEADIYIVNTCTVTHIADHKSRQMLHKARSKNPEAVVVAVGCYVQANEEEILKDPAIDLAIGTQKKKDLVSILEKFLFSREKPGENKDMSLPGRWISDIRTADQFEEMHLTRLPGHTRAYIKIQDGCNQFCSYCIIPYVRGRVRSRNSQEIVSEVKNLVISGCKEIVLTGIHISSYGQESGGEEALSALIDQLQRIPELRRIRLGSLEPGIISRDFAEKMAAYPKVCPHFHLSLQSGCDETLKRMNRKYTTDEYYEKIVLLREAYKDRNPAITTDIIAGFPGETSEEFDETCRFLEQCSFYRMHVFKYSSRQGTPAAKMMNQIPEQVKAKRRERLQALHDKMFYRYLHELIGREVEVIIEEKKEIDGEQYWIGYTGEYVKAVMKPEFTIEGFVEDSWSGFQMKGCAERIIDSEWVLLRDVIRL